MKYPEIQKSVKDMIAKARGWLLRMPLMVVSRRLLNPPLPFCAEIETTTVCTRKCAYCPVASLPRPAALMEEKTFRKIIDDLEELGFKGEIHPHFYGEPLCDARLEGLVTYAKEKLPDSTVKVYTNGDLLTRERFDSLRNSGVDLFRISLHEGKLKDHVVELKNQYPEVIEIVGYSKDANNLMNRGGLLNIPRRPEKACYFVNSVTIDYQGNMLLCCNDYCGSVILGNVNKESIKTIWRRNRVRRSFIMSGLWFYPICRKC